MPVVACPRCKTVTSVRPELLSSRVQCGGCGRRFTAALQAQPAAPPAPPPLPAAAAASSPVEEAEPAARRTRDVRHCSGCGEAVILLRRCDDYEFWCDDCRRKMADWRWALWAFVAVALFMSGVIYWAAKESERRIEEGRQLLEGRR
jgi:hypothetical protein